MLTDFEKKDSAFFSVYSYTREECTSRGYLTGKCRTLTLWNGQHRSVSSVVIFWRNALKGTNAARPCAMKTTNLLIAKLHATCGYGHEPENSTAVARSRQKRLSCSRQTQVRKIAENCRGFFKRRSHLMPLAVTFLVIAGHETIRQGTKNLILRQGWSMDPTPEERGEPTVEIILYYRENVCSKVKKRMTQALSYAMAF